MQKEANKLMRIEAKQVKSGECIVLSEGQEKLVIDCGSDNRTEELAKEAFACSQLLPKLQEDCTVDLLISHFHEDHFNGLLGMKRKPVFQNIYIPPCITHDMPIITEAMTQMLLLGSNRNWGFRLTKNIIDLIERLPILAQNRVRIVQAGNKIRFAGKEYDVLWPRISQLEIEEPRRKVKSNEEEDFFKVVLEEYGSEAGSYVSAETAFRDLQQSFDELVSEYLLERPLFHERVLPELQNFENSLYSYMNIFQSDEEINRRQYAEARDRLDRSFRQLRSYFRQYVLLLPPEILQHINAHCVYTYHYMVNSINATSIILAQGTECLFLGDAPAQLISRLRKEEVLKNHYKVVKLQHHATRAYSTIDTPAADYYMISNGGIQKRKISRAFIDDPFMTAEGASAEHIVCTNRSGDEKFCEYKKEVKVCSPKCSEDYFIEM